MPLHAFSPPHMGALSFNPSISIKKNGGVRERPKRERKEKQSKEEDKVAEFVIFRFKIILRSK